MILNKWRNKMQKKKAKAEVEVETQTNKEYIHYKNICDERGLRPLSEENVTKAELTAIIKHLLN